MNENLLPRQDVLKPHTEQVNQLVFSWNKLLLLQSDFLFPISHDNEGKCFHYTEFNYSLLLYTTHFGDRRLLYRNSH